MTQPTGRIPLGIKLNAARLVRLCNETDGCQTCLAPHLGPSLIFVVLPYNSMLERLEAAFKKIIQFTADASHELRTPVAIKRTRTDLSLRKPRSADEYRETIAQVHSEPEKTSDLVEKLIPCRPSPFSRVGWSWHGPVYRALDRGGPRWNH